jgi:hypothetical protein
VLSTPTPRDKPKRHPPCPLNPLHPPTHSFHLKTSSSTTKTSASVFRSILSSVPILQTHPIVRAVSDLAVPHLNPLRTSTTLSNAQAASVQRPPSHSNGHLSQFRQLCSLQHKRRTLLTLLLYPFTPLVSPAESAHSLQHKPPNPLLFRLSALAHLASWSAGVRVQIKALPHQGNANVLLVKSTYPSRWF